MMQMQKLQLEAAAAQAQESQKLDTNDSMSEVNENTEYSDATNVSFVRNNNLNDFLMMGNVFESIISDIMQ